MSKTWLELQTDSEAWDNAYRADYEGRNAIHNGIGEFWADKIKRYRKEPAKRLEVALENLPLPGAFREAKIALRSIIRMKRKDDSNYESELAKLYHLAAIESFSIPYSQRLKAPGYVVIEHTPGGKLDSLPFDYYSLGYRFLDLSKTDIKWMIDKWGEPNRHSSLHKDFHDLWLEQEIKYQAGFERKLKELCTLPGFEKLRD